MSRVTFRLLLCLIAALLTAAPLVHGADWYVSTSGSSGGNGSIGSPWDLQTALNDANASSAIAPGDTIWLRGGTYDGLFTSSLNGTSGNPIKVRSYTGEWAVLRGSTTARLPATLQDNGSYTWWMDFEITTAGTDRISAQSTPWPDDINFAFGYQGGDDGNNAVGCKVIDLVIHNTSEALSLWIDALNFEAIGCLLYHSGWDAPDRGHGHNLYLQNNTGTKLLKDNIVWAGFSYGGQAYGSGDFVKNFTFQYNTFFDCGDDSTIEAGELLLVGAGEPNAAGIVLTGNMGYRRNENMNNGIKIGYSGPNIDANLQYNYLACGLKLYQWNDLTFRNNTLIGPRCLINPLNTDNVGSVPAYDWDYNTYHCTETSDAWGHYKPFYRYYGSEYRHTWAEWRSVTGYDDNSSYSTVYPTTLVTFVRASPYISGHGSVTFFNWADSNSINVDISSIIDNGQAYEIKDAQNFFGSALASGTYGGGTVSVPVTSTTAAQPTGNAPKSYTHTPKTFGVLIVRATSGGGGAPGTPTGLTASDGTYSTKVALDWADTSGATSYKVYRNTTNNSGTATQISTPTASAYDDTTASTNTTYYYWVKACNASGDSGFSSSEDRLARGHTGRPDRSDGQRWDLQRQSGAGLGGHQLGHQLQGLPQHHQQQRHGLADRHADWQRL